MIYLKAYDQKTEKFLWVLLFNREDIIKMIREYIHLPIKKEMLNCHEITMIYHETRKESIKFIKQLINDNPSFIDIKRDLEDE